MTTAVSTSTINLRTDYQAGEQPSAADLNRAHALLATLYSFGQFLTFRHLPNGRGIECSLDEAALLTWLRGNDLGMTRVNADDDLHYLENQFLDRADPPEYSATTDLPVKSETVDDTDQTLRLFLPAPAGAGLAIDSGKLAVDIAGQTEHTSGDPSAMHLLLWTGSAYRKITVANLLKLLGTLSASGTNQTLGKDASGNVGWESPGAFSCE